MLYHPFIYLSYFFFLDILEKGLNFNPCQLKCNKATLDLSSPNSVLRYIKHEISVYYSFFMC